MRVAVAAGEHAYDIVLTAGFEGLGEALAGALGATPGPCVLVTNPVVAPLHGAAATAALERAGWAVTRRLIPDGEASKTLSVWAALLDEVLAAGVDRRTPILALGGGVTGDLVGFAAASALRGLPFVQVPTTLLAMVDSSVGGKTGVNAVAGKNLIGAFHPPVLVWAALDTLRTLPDDELRCGLGEVVKHAVLSGEPALARCEALVGPLLARDPEALRSVVEDSIRVKAGVVQEDPFERGRRALLNLGHTVGHALEHALGYGALRHGEAVALGLVAEAELARARGWATDPALASRLDTLVSRLGIPRPSAARLDPHALVRALAVDKKRERGTIRLAVPLEAGRVELRGVALADAADLFCGLSLITERSP